MMIFLTLLSLPAILNLAFFILSFFSNGRGKITLKEFSAHMGIQMIVAAASAGIIYASNVRDVEVWNGRVASKAKVEVSCSHSYECNCVTSCSTNSNGTQSCSTICSTCYEHSNDYDWMVQTTNNESIEIDRIDRQGADTPPRWAAVAIGEPTSVSHSYINYVKAAPDSLFRRQGLLEKYQDSIPAYPPTVYDYYRMNHFVDLGAGLDDTNLWNVGLAEMNGDLGAAKQANIGVVVTKGKEPDWALAVEQAWIGGKKNDIFLIANIEGGKASWVYVMAWTKNDLFKVKMRDEILALPVFSPEAVLPILRSNVIAHYERKPMKDFEYLKASITPSMTQYVVAIIFGCIISIAAGIYFWKENPFEDESYSSRRRF